MSGHYTKNMLNLQPCLVIHMQNMALNSYFYILWVSPECYMPLLINERGRGTSLSACSS